MCLVAGTADGQVCVFSLNERFDGHQHNRVLWQQKAVCMAAAFTALCGSTFTWAVLILFSCITVAVIVGTLG